MAKIAFTKLALSKNTSIKEVEWKDQKIEIKQYLPVGEKLDLISRVINLSVDQHVFYNPCKVEIFELIEIILAYTNINLTEKQSEDILKLYDLFISSGFVNKIKENIPEEEIKYINNSIWATIKEIYRYRDSAMGIMQQIVEDYKDVDLDARKITEQLSNTENLSLIKDVVTKLG